MAYDNYSNYSSYDDTHISDAMEDGMSSCCSGNVALDRCMTCFEPCDLIIEDVEGCHDSEQEHIEAIENDR